MNIWEILGIEPTKDKKVIKRAYAAQTKIVHPEEKPEEFKLLHEAYQAALRYAESDENQKIDFGRYGRSMNGKYSRNTNSEYSKDTYEKYSETSDDDNAELTMTNPSYEPEDVDNTELVSFFNENQDKQQQRVETFMQYWQDFDSPYQNPEASAQWREYLASEDFQNIRWSSRIMKFITEEINGRYVYGTHELKMLFWEAYGFREDDELEYQGEQLKLRKCLYQAYAYQKRTIQVKEWDIKSRKIRRVFAGLALVGVLALVIIIVRYNNRKGQSERSLIEQYMSEHYPGIEITVPEKNKQDSRLNYTFHSSAHPEFLITADIWYYYEGNRSVAKVMGEDYGLQLVEYYAAQYGLACGRLEYEDEVYSVLFYPDIEQADVFCRILKKMFDEEEELNAIHSVGVCAGNVLFPEVLVSGGLSQFPFADLQIFDPHAVNEEELSSQIRETYMIYMFQYESWNLTAEQYEEWGSAYEKLCEQWEDSKGSWYDMHDPDTGEFLCRLYIPTYEYTDGYYSGGYKRAITVGSAYYFMLDREANVTVKEDGSGFKVEFYGETKTFGEKPEVEFNELRKWY